MIRYITVSVSAFALVVMFAVAQGNTPAPKKDQEAQKEPDKKPDDRDLKKEPAKQPDDRDLEKKPKEEPAEDPKEILKRINDNLDGLGKKLGDDKKTDVKDEPKAKGVLPKYYKSLGLTDEQKQTVYKVQTKFNGEIEKLQKKIDDLKAERNAEVEKVLTKTQLDRLKELKLGEKKDSTTKDKDAKDKDSTTKDKDAKDKDKEKDKKDK